MKLARNYISPYTVTSFKDYLAEPSLTLCTCWKLVSKTDEVVAATSHTRDLELTGHPNIVFKSAQGVVPSAVDNEIGLGSAGLEVDSVFSVNVLDEEGVASGDWDGAYFEVFVINYIKPEMGELVMFAGTIGEVKTYGERFRAEGRPLSNKATQQIGNVYTETCVVRRFGDAQCKVPVTLGSVAHDGGIITTTGIVTTGGSNTQFTDSNRQEVTGYYTHGTVKFTSGELSGREAEILNHVGGTGSRTHFVTDESWKNSTVLNAGWEQTAFVEGANWHNSVAQSRNGEYPWLRQVTNFPLTSLARYIWWNDSRHTAYTGTVYFRKTFTPNVNSGTIIITADNQYELFVNGVHIGESSNWVNAQTFVVNLNVGVPNVIAVRGVNTFNGNQTNPAGILADVTLAPYVPAGVGSTLYLSIAMPRLIAAGTTYQITRGCDRKWTTCKGAYDNLINIRATPFVPGIEKAYKVVRP